MFENSERCCVETLVGRLSVWWREVEIVRCRLALMEFACSEETVVCRQFDPKYYSLF